MNLLDIAIVIILIFSVISGMRRGFLLGIIELIGIVISVYIPVLFYIPTSSILENLGIPQVYSGALAFLIIFFIAISVYFSIAKRFYQHIPNIIRISGINRVLGLFTGLAKGLVIVTLVLVVFTSLPMPFITSEHIENSNFSSPLLNAATEATSLTSDIFGEPFQNLFKLYIIEPESGESISLGFSADDPDIDKEAEKEMLRQVNEERTKRGLPKLTMDETLSEVARKHSVDMLQRGYFSHRDPEGNTPFQRMQAGGVSFISAGENLAFAPTVSIAHRELMNSPGHRENILQPQFGRVGIGAARDDRYGIMFTQNFAN